MTQQELKIGMRVYHPIFKWGTVRMPPNKDKSLVDFDFNECSYYIMGQGYKTFKKSEGMNTIYLPNDQLFGHLPKREEITKGMILRALALNATVDGVNTVEHTRST